MRYAIPRPQAHNLGSTAWHSWFRPMGRNSLRHSQLSERWAGISDSLRHIAVHPATSRRRGLARALPAMYGASDPAAAERTAFRRAEKQYKLYKPLNLKGRSRSRSGCKPSSGEGGGADLSAVVDFHALLAADGELPSGIDRRNCPGFDRPVFCFLDRPGNCDLLSVILFGAKIRSSVYYDYYYCYYYLLANMYTALRTGVLQTLVLSVRSKCCFSPVMTYQK